MPYIRETCKAGVTWEECRYHSHRYPGKGGRRGKWVNQTAEAQRKVNMRRAAKELRRAMNANFVDGDLLVRLDFCKTQSPSGSCQMQGHMQAFLRKLRTAYKKLGVVLKYIYVKEVGPRGGRHVHMVMTDCPGVLKVLRCCWTYGGIHVDPLNSGGQYRKVAEYFIKYAGRTEETEGQMVGKRWYPSKNLTRPQVRREVIRARTFRKAVRGRSGYVLEKDSVRYGISAYSGYEYFSYTLIRVGGAGVGGKAGKGSAQKGRAGRGSPPGGGGRPCAAKQKVAPVQPRPCQASPGSAGGAVGTKNKQEGEKPCLKNSGSLTPHRS